MMTNEFETLSALIDGEPVDPGELERALALPGSRQVLVDLAGLRNAFAQDRARPREQFYERMEAVLAAAADPVSEATGGGRGEGPVAALADRGGRWRWAVLFAVATVLALLLLPLWVASKPELSQAGPPPPDRVLRFEPDIDWSSH